MSRIYDALRKLEEHDSEPARKASRSSNISPENLNPLPSVPSLRARLTPESRLVVSSDRSGAGAERFRLIRMGLRNLQAANSLKSLLITSALPGDGKSTIALNLATFLADGGKSKVLLLEADLRRPCLTHVLGLDAWPGLTHSVEAGTDPASAIRRIEPLELFLLPAGKPVDNPLEIIQSERFSAILRDFRSRFDWILFDSPPAFPLADTMALKVHADGTLLVARADTTPREAVQEALGLFQPGHVIGIILNAASGVNHLYSKYYHRKELQTPAESLDGQRDEKRGVAENQSVSGRVYS